MKRQVILLVDGYTGKKRMFYSKPLETDGDIIKLACAEPGMKGCIKWVSNAEYQAEMQRAPFTD